MEIREPHLVHSDSMGHPYTFWQQVRETSDGCCVIGNGQTKCEAISDAQKHFDAYETFLALPDISKLEVLIDKPSILDKDKELAIRIMGKLVIALYNHTMENLREHD